VLDVGDILARRPLHSLGGPTQGGYSIENLTGEDIVRRHNPSGIGAVVFRGFANPNADLQTRAPSQQLPEVLWGYRKQCTRQFVGPSMSMLDQVIAQTRECLERYVLGLVLEQRGDLMTVQPRIFNNCLDRARPLLSIRGVTQEFG
jgi:hypothetical protein